MAGDWPSCDHDRQGEVDSWRDRSAAEHAAWSVPGVMSVDDLIVVR
ncbi:MULTISPECIES: BON domain-containing protein [Bradyrhizobium]|jgi:osmotically-inducible protein OsmY